MCLATDFFLLVSWWLELLDSCMHFLSSSSRRWMFLVKGSIMEVELEHGREELTIPVGE